jgi:hypothetical protein
LLAQVVGNQPFAYRYEYFFIFNAIGHFSYGSLCLGIFRTSKEAKLGMSVTAGAGDEFIKEPIAFIDNKSIAA